MKQNYSRHLINALRHEVAQDLTKQSIIEQFTNLVNNSDPKTLQFIGCQLALLESFVRDGE